MSFDRRAAIRSPAMLRRFLPWQTAESNRSPSISTAPRSRSDFSSEATMSEPLIARVRAALADVPDVEEKKMFGGITFMVNTFRQFSLTEFGDTTPAPNEQIFFFLLCGDPIVYLSA